MQHHLIKGFTLLELLVVLALISLLAGMVVPNLQRTIESIERSTQREQIISDIGQLSYRAFTAGMKFELNEEKLGVQLPDGSPMLLLPEGWTINISKPIGFNFNGFCTGGEIQIIGPDKTSEQVTLLKTSCEVKTDASTK